MLINLTLRSSRTGTAHVFERPHSR